MGSYPGAGAPRRRIGEFAHDRGAQLVIVGSRRRRLGRSVACGADRPVVVAAQRTARLALAHSALPWHTPPEGPGARSGSAVGGFGPPGRPSRLLRQLLEHLSEAAARP